ncbi:MAG: hypothetical protein HOP28_01505 [Gemmatimonadales bacterium]|nr:hypothetical protein [Gemmatimonadales bacterium]
MTGPLASLCPRAVLIPVGPLGLRATLCVPSPIHGTVIFAQGSGSSRLSPGNQHLTELLQAAGLGTLLLDLLTVPEEGMLAHHFHIDLLAERLLDATEWIRTIPETAGHPIGYFGANSGAGAALAAAAREPDLIAGVVSRGGRPDLAGSDLSDVQAPTLLIVGSYDSAVLEVNRRALGQLRCAKRLVVIPGAGHLFEEVGALDQVAGLASNWLAASFQGAASPPVHR